MMRDAKVIGMGYPRAWSFIVLGDDRQYAGNEGYLDEPRCLYRYDSHVGNHKQVSAGDIAILRDREAVLGIARIDEIRQQAGSKVMRRCPSCGRTSIKPRRTKLPEYRCNCRHEFEAPRVESETVILYEAHYGGTYVDTLGAVSIDRLKGAALRPGDQNSIEELDLSHLEPSFLHFHPATGEIFTYYHRALGKIPSMSSGN
jgi:putative restriction endonuclease